MKTKKPKRPKDVHAFVDTNIFLDFYRSSTPSNLTLLSKLDTVRERIISTYQVEMEFLKNRQRVIIDSYKKKDLLLNIQLPAVLQGTNAAAGMAKRGQGLRHGADNLSKQIEKIIDKPERHDPVFKALRAVFNSPLEHVLTRDMSIRHQIKRKAWRRFMLGYPPRKSGDNSIGDALNWEWVLHSANRLTGDIVIVSRDQDFGMKFENNVFLNDALKFEYKDRVGPRRKVILTDRLSDALERLHVSVTAKEKSSEEEQIRDLMY